VWLKRRAHALIMFCIFLMMVGLLMVGCPPEHSRETVERVEFAADEEFIVHEKGLPAFEETYNFHFEEVHEMTIGLTHEALRAEHVDVAKGFSTDGRIKELSLMSLEDDKSFFDVHYTAPIVRKDTLEKYPKIEDHLDEVASNLDTSTMKEFNYLVDIKEKEIAEVVRDWLLNENLISEEPPEQPQYTDNGTEKVVIGAKDFVIPKILGQITYEVLKNRGVPVEEILLFSRPETVRSALDAEKIHICWENTGVALQDIYHKEKVPDGGEAYYMVSDKDAEKGFKWLNAALFENTQTIMMRQEHAEELDISTMSELAEWVNQVQEGEYIDTID